jgi:hypothetical protein
MQKKLIYAFLGLITIIIVAIVVLDILGSRPEKRGDNPFSLNVDGLRDVDPELILYDETKNLKLQSGEYRGMDISGDQLFVISDNYLQGISTSGQELIKFILPESPRAVLVDGDRVYIGFLNSVCIFSFEGDLLSAFQPINDSAVVTNMAIVGDYLFVADAGNRQVLRYTLEGELLGRFHGKRESDDNHGFIVPSANFDLVNNDDELWVVNPGMHTLENYSESGELRGYWESLSMTIEGFGGCCNPARISVLPNGQFVTSEKGLIRVKIYNQSGKFAGVVAAPKKFDEGSYAPDIAVSDEGVIYALDFDRDMIRIFEEK